MNEIDKIEETKEQNKKDFVENVRVTHKTTFDFSKPLDEQGLQMCDHCNGYGSSLKDPEGVDRCTKCGGTGVMPLTCPNCGGWWNPETKKIDHHPAC